MDQGGRQSEAIPAAGGAKALAQAVGDARRAVNLTQEELCAQAGISYSTLAKIERGAIKTPSVFTIAAIAKATQTAIEDLVAGSAEIRSNKQPKHYQTSKSGIRFVFFDVNGVLVCFYQRAFTKMARDTGLSEVKIESTFWRYNDSICRGEITATEFNQLMSQQLGVDKIDWYGYYLEAISPVEETQACLEQAAKNFGVGLLTNIMPGLLDILIKQRKLPDIAYDVIMDSSTTGLIKPETAFYELAMARAGVNPEQILFIDDSPTNLMSAERLGWQVLRFDICAADQAIAAIETTLQY